MALPFGVSWLCTLLLWGCLCFPPQKGYNVAHGYSFNNDEISSYAGVLGPQTSTQFNSGANPDSVSPGDETQDMQHQSFVSPQREPADHEYNKDVGSVTGPGEDKLVQSEPAPTPSVQQYEQVNSGHQHPFGLLLKEHTHKKTVEAISFSTIRDLKNFIETMKSSYLAPGSDLSKHFQTARQTMKNEMASGAQNIKGESSNSVEEGSAQDDGGENEVWSEPTNSVFEQSEQGANYEMPSESLSVPDSVISTAGLISPSAYESQDSGLGSALYSSPQLAATEHVSSNYGRFSNAGFSGETPELLTRPPDVQIEDVQSTRYALPEQIPLSSSSLYGEDFSSSGHVAASPLDPPVSSAQDLRYYSSKTSNITPLTSEQKIQQPKYTSHSKDSPKEYQKPSDGFELGKYFQSESLAKVTPQKPPSSYGKSIYVSTSRGQRPSSNIPDPLPTHGERPVPSVQRYQPTLGKGSKDTIFSPTVHLPVSSGSVSSSSDILSPQSSSGHEVVQASSPHDPQNQVFNRKQPIKSHLVFTVKTSSSPHSSSRHNLGYQSVSVSLPSNLYTREKDEEKSDLSEPALVSAIQEPKHMTANTPIPISSGLDVSFNSLTNLPPTSESKKVFSRLVGDEIMSRNSETRKMISDMFPTGIYGARKPSGLFSTPIRRGNSLKVFASATRAGLLQTLMQPSKQKRPANMNKKPVNMANRPLRPLSTSKVSGSTLSGVLRRNDGYRKRPPVQNRPNMSPPVNTYVVKSRNRYARSKVSLTKTRYTPHVLTEGEAGKDQWKPAQRPPKYYNIASHNVKELEESQRSINFFK